MPKVIQSKSKRWAGTVTIADPLTLPQAEAIEEALGQPDDMSEQGNKRVWVTADDKKMLPAIVVCVEKWDLAGLDPDRFPFSPRGESHNLILQIFLAITEVYFGEKEIPNVS